MVETDGIQDVSNETEVPVKQRSLVNRHLNGTNGIAKANKDPPKNLVILFFILPLFVFALHIHRNRTYAN